MDSIIQSMYEEQKSEFRKNCAYQEELSHYRELGEELQTRLAKEDIVFLLRLMDSANALRDLDGRNSFQAGLKTGVLWMLKALE